MGLFQQIRAKLNKTFVTECPQCHATFYGFEKWHQNVAFVKDGKKINYRYLCDKCFNQVSQESLAIQEKR